MHNLAINHGLLQSDIDFAGFKALNADLSDYKGLPGIFINVKSAPYNATGDGVTDDSAAINAALGDIFLAGGGTLFFPRGIYLCNGLNSPYNSVIQLPYVNAATTSAMAVRLLGETTPPWSVATTFTEARNSTIKTTQVGSGSFPALLAGSVGRSPGIITYTDMNNIMVSIENMSFIVPDNPTIHGVRLDGVGWAMLNNVRVFAGNAGTEPMTNTCGLWLPASQNFSINTADRVTVAGFYTNIRSGEHLRAPMIQTINSKVGIEFTDGIYPSWACLQIINCVDGIKFSGYHPVDLLVETEHSPSGWTTASHDISDASNYGTGVIKYFIGNGHSGTNNNASLSGGAGLTLINIFSGDVTLNTATGSGGALGGAKITGKGTVPAGGTGGYVLTKTTGTDYDYAWAAASGGGVPTSRILTIGGTALDLTADRTWLANVTNDTQTKASIAPNTPPSAGQLLVGNAGGTAYAPITLGTDATLASTGALTIANNAVSLAKLADIATDSILGRATAATGDPEVLTALPFAYTGDVTRPADSNVTTLAAGNAGNLNAGTLLAARMPALTGDVTTSAGAVATTIANDIVTYAKMQNVAASRLLGRDNSGAGDPQELTVSGATFSAGALAVTNQVGGSNTQVQYNNSGVFGGIANATSNGTTLTLTAPTIVPPILMQNTGGNIKLTSTNAVTGEDLTIRSETVNNRTALRVMPNGAAANFPSAFEFFGTDFQADGTNFERFSIRAKGSGDTYYSILTDAGGTGTRRPIALTADSTATQLVLSTTGPITVGGTDTGFSRNAAGVLEINNGTAGTFKDIKVDRVNAVTGYRINGAAASGKILIGDGTNFIASTPTYPNAASTTGKLVQSDGTNLGMSAATWPTLVTAGAVVIADGTNYIADTTPTFVDRVTLSAGSTTIAPLVYQSGTNVTTPVAGAGEYDGVQKYFTIDTTSNRGAIPVEQYFHLTANGSAITTIANFFGATSNINIVASAYYIIDVYFWYVTTGTGAVTFTFTNSAAPTSQNILWEMSPVGGVVAPPGTATMLVGQILNDATAARTVVTGSLTAATHYAHVKIWLKNGTGTTFKIQATAGGTNLTPQIGSWWHARRLSPNNIGTFAA